MLISSTRVILSRLPSVPFRMPPLVRLSHLTGNKFNPDKDIPNLDGKVSICHPRDLFLLLCLSGNLLTLVLLLGLCCRWWQCRYWIPDCCTPPTAQRSQDPSSLEQIITR